MEKVFIIYLIVFYCHLSNAYFDFMNRKEFDIKKKETDELEDERVIGGREALPGECPFQVALLANKRFICGGSLIRSNVVLTAAHCVYGSTAQYSIRYNTLQYESGPTIDVIKAIVHPEYNTRTNDNDIALLILKSDFVSNTNAKTLEMSNSEPQPNSLAQVSGWGRTSPSSNAVSPVLKVANLTVMSRVSCQQRMATLQITRGMICVIDPTVKSSSCNGDSGGPLVQNGKQIGIVSFGPRNCLNKYYPNVFTKVRTHIQWITTTITRNIG